VARVKRPIRIALLAVCLLLVGSAQAGAANCGATLIDEYFTTGRIGYHPQDCYASALRQIDPDARMYSGIIGAIRAARGRDLAQDNAAATRDSSGGAAGDATPTEPQPLPPVDADAVAITTPVDTAIPALPLEPTSAASVPAAQAAAIEEAASAGIPLSVAVFAGLAALLTLVGLAGLAVRRLDRGY
jgi:uncharacterized protein YdbL (DUF1318 family)